VLKKYGPSLYIGDVAGAAAPNAAPATTAVAPAAKKVHPNRFGELVPYGDPSWYAP